MSEYNNPRPLPTASASDPCTIVDNAISFDKVINGNSTVTTYKGKQILSLSQALDLFGFGVAPFTFAQGGILQSKNLLVSNDPVDSFLYKYVGADSFPLTVTAGTNPTVGSDWQPFTATDHNSLSNRNAAGAHDASAVTTDGGGSVQDFIDAQYTTVAELATGKFKVGQYVRLTDRAMGLFLLRSGGTSDGIWYLDAGNGNIAEYIPCAVVIPEHLGADGTGVIDSTANIISAIQSGYNVNGYGTYLLTEYVSTDVDNVVIALNKVVYDGVTLAYISEEDLIGVVTVQGTKIGTEVNLDITSTCLEGSNRIYLSNVAGFAVGDYWRIKPPSTQWGVLSHMVNIVGVGAGYIDIDYVLGWDLPATAGYRFQKISTVKNTKITINELDYQTVETGTNGIAGIAMQYCIMCDGEVVNAKNTQYAAIMKRWSKGGESYLGELESPQNISTGGVGYGIQLIHCISENILKAKTISARHVFDWSGCAYCNAENVEGYKTLTNTTDFSCHQSYDHDCTISNFIGWLSWANDLVFGRSMKRMKASNGEAIGQLAFFNSAPDCTFEDVRVIGDIIINADGATLRNVSQSGGTLRFNQTSTLSARGTTELWGCDVAPWLGGDWIPSAITTPIIFNGGTISPMNSSVTRGATVIANNAAFSSSSTAGQPGFIYTTDFQINGGTQNYNAWRVLGTASKLTITGVVVQNFNDPFNGFVDCRILSGAFDLDIKNLRFSADTNTRPLIKWTGAGGTLRLSCQAMTATNGSVEINSSIGASGYVNFCGTMSEGTGYARPAASSRIQYSSELLL